MDEHLDVIETSAILKLLDAQRNTHEALYDLVMIMRQKQREHNDQQAYPKPEMSIKK